MSFMKMSIISNGKIRTCIPVIVNALNWLLWDSMITGIEFRVYFFSSHNYNDYELFTFYEFTHPYCGLHSFVVNNLDKADQEIFEFHKEGEYDK